MKTGLKFSDLRVGTTIFCLLMTATICRADEIDFNREIRPILSENCFYCHGQDGNKRQADLRLDDREAAVDFGAIEPGDADASTLIERIFSEDEEALMPPVDSNRRLSADQKQLLKNWIQQGAKYETHWAFATSNRPAMPSVKNADWPQNPIDYFVLAKLEQRGWQPSPPAERTTLIKRLYADLVGLPPTPAEVESFVADADSAAYDRLVDRLLASPHYGERMALPWLDAARYADSNGFQQDGDTWQWLWRDWVVKALNEDLPFDKFSIWQLAGDLLPEATTEQKIASGFNRNHLLNGEGGSIAEEQRFNNLFDRIDTTATTWLGLTMACAQCHDHKYDPITQKEYYQLLDAFNRVPETGGPQQFSKKIRVGKPVLELRDATFDSPLAEAKEATEKKRDADDIPRPMIMSDAQPRETHILDRGAYLSPLELVSFDTPAFLPPMPESAPRNRLGFANWLFAAEHPLTSRVQVNRMWQHFFGLGIVKTSEDFGVQAEFPIHRELLDWLAVEFREKGWSQKHMHRLIVTSATYQQSSRMSAEHRNEDIENRLYARASRMRMPSFVLRDWALKASGLINEKIGGKPVYPYQPGEVWEALQITKERDFTYPASSGSDLYRRSIYTFWRRTVAPTNMFDASDRQACRVRASITSTPLHALTTLNDPTWVEAARVLAELSLKSSEDRSSQLQFAFQRVMCRVASDEELKQLQDAFARQLSHYIDDLESARAFVSVGVSPRDETLDAAEHAALSAVCLAILNLDEALTRE